MTAPAPRLSSRWSQLAPCPDCGMAIVVAADGAPVTGHRGSRLCRELAAERAAAPKPEPQPEEPRP